MSVAILARARSGAGNADQARAFLDKIFPRRSIAKILLVTPPDADAGMFRFETAKRGRYTNYPPYGSLVLARQLRDVGVDARILNLNNDVLQKVRESASAAEFRFDEVWHEALDRELREFQPDFVGVTCMFTMTHTSLKHVCQRIGAQGYPMGIGGVHVSNDVDRVLDDISSASFAFTSEGDCAIKTFVRVVNGIEDVSALGQVIFNDTDGKRRLRFEGDLQPSEQEISVIPAYDLIDIDQYSQRGTIGAFYCFKPKGARFATVLSNRGCRAQCTFCSVRNFNGVGVRQRSVKSVVDEIDLLVNQYGIEHIMWLDDDLYKNEKRMIELCNEIVRRRLGITWDATNGLIAASCTDEVIAASAESGCIAVNIGMESGNPEILRKVKKPGTVKNFLKAAEVLRRYEQIHASVFLIVGFPNETMRMIFDSIKVATAMDLDWYRISQLQPLPNTPIYDSMVEQGLITKVGDRELRFMGGAYGKQTEIEQGLRAATEDFEAAFSSIPLDAVPTADQLTDVWFYMNYHLNFHRIFHERRPEKIRQLMAHLQVLGDVISPENAFALYFLGFLQHRQTGSIEPEIIDRLRQRLDTSGYWRDRFHAFGLALDHLVERNFPNEAVPRVLPSSVAAEITAAAHFA
jgi:radical SAM superfamily enzyme YgiQ (UPF0313 family)